MICGSCKRAADGLPVLREAVGQPIFDALRLMIVSYHDHCESRSCSCQHAVPEIVDHQSGKIIGMSPVDAFARSAEPVIKVHNPGLPWVISEEALADAEDAAAPVRDWIKERFDRFFPTTPEGIDPR